MRSYYRRLGGRPAGDGDRLPGSDHPIKRRDGFHRRSGADTCADDALRTCFGSDGGRQVRAGIRRGQALHPGYGRDQRRHVPHRRPAPRQRGEHDRGFSAIRSGRRHRDHRRGRRIDRVGRRSRGLEGGSSLGGGRSRTGVLRPRRSGADRYGRLPHNGHIGRE